MKNKNKQKRNKVSFELHEYGLMITCMLLYLQIAGYINPSIMITLAPMFFSYFLEYVLMIFTFSKEIKKSKGRRR